MKKALVGLTAVAALATSFAVAAPTPASARPDWKKDRHHYSYRHRDHRRHDDGVTLRFGSRDRYCTTYWRNGHRYRHCEPSGPSLYFRF